MNEHQFAFANLCQAVEHMMRDHTEEVLAYEREADDYRLKDASDAVERSRSHYEATLTVLARLLGVPFAGLDEDQIA